MLAALWGLAVLWKKPGAEASSYGGELLIALGAGSPAVRRCWCGRRGRCSSRSMLAAWVIAGVRVGEQGRAVARRGPLSRWASS